MSEDDAEKLLFFIIFFLDLFLIRVLAEDIFSFFLNYVNLDIIIIR